MTNKEAVNWIINLSADIGKSEHSELWNYEQALYEIRKMLESAQQWTPVSEGLPSYGEDVLVSIGKYVNVGYLVQVSDDDGQYNWFYSGWYHPLSEVDAWMPLPEPWEGKE